MSLAQAITSRIVAPYNPNSTSGRARQRRWLRFRESFPDISEMRVLDLGGTPDYWLGAPQRPRAVTVVNLLPYPGHRAEFVTAVQGDACDLPPGVDRSGYDLVVSNSLIEHVGGHAQRLRLADTIHRAADRHWVQTPYRYFPVEPHWLFPGLQFLPFPVRVQVTMRWPLGHFHTHDFSKATESVHEVELLGRSHMRSYFPDSELWLERMAGLPKSMVAIRN
jgi:hypothetical protein